MASLRRGCQGRGVFGRIRGKDGEEKIKYEQFCQWQHLRDAVSQEAELAGLLELEGNYPL